MKAIIIEDKDARKLLESLELEKYKTIDNNRNDWDLVQTIHGHFHYVVCRWLQDQGADVVRKG